MSQLILYGTSACHLCDEALAITLPAAEMMNLTLCQIDIAGDEALEAQYGLCIPVLAKQSGDELCWPFDDAMVLQFLHA